MKTHIKSNISYDVIKILVFIPTVTQVRRINPIVIRIHCLSETPLHPLQIMMYFRIQKGLKKVH